MHKTISEAVELAKAICTTVSTESKILIAPAFTALSEVSKVTASTPIRLGAQNMAVEDSGAHTGEISPLMLLDAGVQTVILGHSERRSLYAEGDELINRKVHLALSHGLEVILCVGETIDEREAGNAESVVESQLKGCLAGIDGQSMSTIVVAYEPVWAIGTGKTATPEDADGMHAFIRAKIGEWYSNSTASNLIIQYGGSVKPENAVLLMAKPNIDGALVGGASLTAESFAAIAHAQ